MTPEQRANRILLDAARDAYVRSEPRPMQTILIDMRCPACGIARAVCESATCIRRPA